MLKIFAQASDYARACEIMFWQPINERYYPVKRVEFELDTSYDDTSAGLLIPTFRLEHKEGQALLQALWDAGYRPHNGEGASAQVEALKENLEDLRYMLEIRR
jgi:hypothetical protein